MNESSVVPQLPEDSNIFPLLPLRGLCAYPEVPLSFDLERKISINALDHAVKKGSCIFLVQQKDTSNLLPGKNDFYKFGTVCKIKQVLRVPGTPLIKVLVDGLYRAEIVEILHTSPYISTVVMRCDDTETANDAMIEILIRNCIDLYSEYAEKTDIPAENGIMNIVSSESPGFVANYIASNSYFKPARKQELLNELNPGERLKKVIVSLNEELELVDLEQKLLNETKEQVENGQKEYFLREQLKVIKKELSACTGYDEDEDEDLDDITPYKEKILALHLQPESEEKLLTEYKRLKKMPFGSSENSLIRAYLDICLELPWNTVTEDIIDIQKAREILDADHYGLEKVKERILEFLSVKQNAPEIKGEIICLVGPPGVGKTSIASSIARAMGRKMARVSLGGVHDEAEIRGHRKTYVGAMPGRIISAISQAKSKNPVIILDEIDKTGSDYRGDPSAALLEALDPDVNSTFRDNFLEIPFDLSSVLFIATANTTDTIPRALLDRMEVIEIGSYTDEEKLKIAENYLLPKQKAKHGIKSSQIRLNEQELRQIITRYTRESGVRILERNIATLCRKASLYLVESGKKSLTINEQKLKKFLGAPKFEETAKYNKGEIGLVRGLAWTSVGGEILDVEASVMDGTGKLELTGNLGQVMQESAKAAITFIRSNSQELNVNPGFYKEKDIHIHFPEGAVPKDGPSAGITVCMAVLSALTSKPVRNDIAMTGEISLRGKILPIGGLREKSMAALRAGITDVIIPKKNVPDLDEIDPLVKSRMNFIPVTDVMEALPHVFSND